MKTIICFITVILILSIHVYSDDSDIALTSFQLKEIEKKNKSANALIISGAVAAVLGGVMIGTWVAEDDSLIISPTTTTRDTIAKSPVRLISGVILSTTGVALEVGGIIKKIKAKKMEKQFLENNRESERVSFYIKPNGIEFVYNF